MRGNGRERPVGFQVLLTFTIDDHVDSIYPRLYWLAHTLQISILRHRLAGFDRRATMTTGPALESFLDGIGLVESSSWNVNGKSFLVARTIDTGIGGPLVSRANTNKVLWEILYRLSPAPWSPCL